jgi:EAL domain-containing protein (putative c-di-GMP-specific phosphodiesterase class I)
VVNGIDIRLGASVGVALMNKTGSTAANLIQCAELAMYDAKRLGRGGWSFFDETMEQRLRKNIQMESALRNAIERDEFYLVYQPIVDSNSGATVKVEALLRWQSAEFGLVTPDVFIPVLEQSSLIIDVGNWVIESALRQCAEWRQASRVVPVISINISTRQFLQHDFEDQFQRLMQQYQISPEYIELELTESLLADTDTDVAALLKRLSLAGISISIDDFGTGYSSLSYLARFEVDTVKIDQSFIADLESDPRHRSLVKMIIAMGHSLGLKVVAEGVETAAQKEFLQQQHCDYLQGYLFNEPVVPSEIQFENS